MGELISRKEPKKIKNADIIRRLNAIIALLALSSERKVGEIMVILRNAGLRPIEIAQLMGKSLTHVTKELAIVKKGLKKR